MDKYKTLIRFSKNASEGSLPGRDKFGQRTAADEHGRTRVDEEPGAIDAGSP